MKIAVIQAEFNEEFTSRMLEEAENVLSGTSHEHEVFKVPGAHEIPVVTEEALSSDFDGAVALGAVIKGATDHDQLIAYNVSKQLQEMMCNHRKPIGFGVIGPGVSWSQVDERAEQYAREAVKAVVDTRETLDNI